MALADVRTSPPDWSVVPFDIPCPRCASDLTGQDVDACPECGLDLDWPALAPIDRLECPCCAYLLRGLMAERCPECGHPFTWQQVLDAHRARHSGLFEHRYRQRPVRALVFSLKAASRPRRLWATLKLHEPIPGAGLMWLGGLALGCLLVTTMCCHLAALLSSLIPMVLDNGWPPGLRIPWGPLVRVALYVGGVELAWALAVLGGLLVFQQSMARCRVRFIHVVRTWTYATLLPLTAFPVIVSSLWVLRAAGIMPAEDAMVMVVCGVFVLFTGCSLHLGYRLYLRMPHSRAVAATVHLIALLVTLILTINF